MTFPIVTGFHNLPNMSNARTTDVCCAKNTWQRNLAIWSLSLLPLCFSATEAVAQQTEVGFEPPNVAPDSNGVDLISGKFVFPAPQLVIAADPRLTFSHMSEYNMRVKGTHTVADTITWTSSFSIGRAISESFSCSDQGESPSTVISCGTMSPTPSWAKPGGGQFVEASTGRTFDFGLTTFFSNTSTKCTGGSCDLTPLYQAYKFVKYATAITYADGETLSLSYDVLPLDSSALPGSGPLNNLVRISSVVSNRGFEMRFKYQGDTLDASVIGSDIKYLSPLSVAIYARGSYAAPLAKMTFALLPNSSGFLDSTVNYITDMGGGLWTGTYSNILGELPTQASGSSTSPGSTTPQISATSNAIQFRNVGSGPSAYSIVEPLLTSLTKGPNTWTYNYSHAVPTGTLLSQADQGALYQDRTVTVTAPNGTATVVGVNETKQFGGKITYETNAIGARTNYVYGDTDNPRRITQVIFPEGNKEIYSYDARGNITNKQIVAKPGSNLAAISLEAAYPEDISCTAYSKFTPPPITCFRPLWTKDGRGNQTDYTWHTPTGMILSETGPADSSGIRPQTRYSYVERYAWWSDGTGGYVRASSPIWLLASESRCKNSAATGNLSAPCVGGDEMLVTYDYGPDSGPNFLLLRSKTTTSGGLTARVCYAYDAAGNKISETKPLGAGSGCP